MMFESLVKENSVEMKTKLPMGIENYREIRRQKFYYVDKTALIENY